MTDARKTELTPNEIETLMIAFDKMAREINQCFGLLNQACAMAVEPMQQLIAELAKTQGLLPPEENTEKED